MGRMAWQPGNGISTSPMPMPTINLLLVVDLYPDVGRYDLAAHVQAILLGGQRIAAVILAGDVINWAWRPTTRF